MHIFNENRPKIQIKQCTGIDFFLIERYALACCFSGGDTLDEALESAREAVDLHVEGLIEDGEFAKKKGQSRSGFLVEAARTAMHPVSA